MYCWRGASNRAAMVTVLHEKQRIRGRHDFESIIALGLHKTIPWRGLSDLSLLKGWKFRMEKAHGFAQVHTHNSTKRHSPE